MPTPQMSPNMSGNNHTQGAAGPACRTSLAIWPALQNNSLAHFESPSQLHFGLQDAKVPSLPAMIRSRGDFTCSPSWGTVSVPEPAARSAAAIRRPREHPPSNQLGLQTHKESDSPPLDKRTSPKMKEYSPERTWGVRPGPLQIPCELFSQVIMEQRTFQSHTFIFSSSSPPVAYLRKKKRIFRTGKCLSHQSQRERVNPSGNASQTSTSTSPVSTYSCEAFRF